MTVGEPREAGGGEAAGMETAGGTVKVSSGVGEPCEGVSRTGFDEVS